jgi:membrane-bound ClpP family serine protease
MDFYAFLSGLSWLVSLVVVLGVVFVILEIVTPNFGFIGATGVVLLIAGIGALSQIVSLTELVGIIALILIIIFGVLIFTYRSATKGGISRTLVLKTTEDKDKGYVGVRELKEMVGLEGVALTQLRPTGTGEFAGMRIDVVTEGDFISKGTKIKIIDVKGYRTIVSRLDN